MTDNTTRNRWVLAAGLGIITVAAIAAMALAASDQPASTTAEVAPVTTATVQPAVPTGVQARDLSGAEVADILFMREEEKLARDVYITLGKVWDLRIFTNIARSEQTHMDAVYGLIASHDLDDPVGENPVGVFVDPDLQAMYDELIERGSTSPSDALDVAALIEEVDISDLLDAEKDTTAADITAVWEKLLAGSQNHLRAFTSQLAAFGIDRDAAVLNPATYDDILAQASTGARGRPAPDARGRGRTSGGWSS